MSGVHVEAEVITGVTSGHNARLLGADLWELSWLREHAVSQSAAVAGVQLAEEVTAGAHEGAPQWPYVEQLAAAVGLAADVAARRVETYAADAPILWA